MSEQKEYPELQYPYDQKLHAEINGNPRETVVTLGGERVQMLREITVTSGMYEDTVSLEIVHMTSGEGVIVDGYLIAEDDWQYLQAARHAGFKP